MKSLDRCMLIGLAVLTTLFGAAAITQLVIAHFVVATLWVPATLPLLVLVPRGFRSLRRRWRVAKTRCGTCGYDLTANVSGVCPECGTNVDASPTSTTVETDAR